MTECDSKGLLCEVIQNNHITGTRCLVQGKHLSKKQTLLDQDIWQEKKHSLVV